MVTHEDYLAAITVAVCEQYPTTAAALSQVQLVFGVGLRQRALTTFYRAGGGEADASLPLVEIAAVGGLSPPETCHVVLHELAHYRAFEVDHVIPQSRGGTDHIDNLQLLCNSCNRIKGNRTMEYLMARLAEYARPA